MTTPMPFAADARTNLGDPLYKYLMGAAADAPAGHQLEEDRNADEMTDYRLLPRVLNGHPAVDISAEFCGATFAGPLGIGAFAGDLVFHPEGLKPLARVAAKLNLPMAISEETVTPLAELTALHKSAWLQLRAAGPMDRILKLVRHAAEVGAQGMILTVLAPTHPVPGLQPGGYSIGAEIARRGWSTIGSEEPGVAPLPTFPAWGIKEITQVVEETRRLGMPLILKGVLHPDDARRVEEAGASALVLSNIGLRQSSRWVGPVRMIAPLHAATKLPLVLDGGVRSGTDAVIACCLGASMSFLIRPLATALVGGGEEAIEAHLQQMLDEITAMTHWLGAADLSGLSEDHLIREPSA